MNRNALIAAMFSQAVAAGKTVAEAAAAADGINAIPEALLGIVGPTLLASLLPGPVTATGKPLTNDHLAARLERLERFEAKAQKRLERVAASCPMQPESFRVHAPALTAAGLRDAALPSRGFKLDEATDETGKTRKVPGTARSVGFWSNKLTAHVSVTIPGTTVAVACKLTGQASATVVSSNLWTQEERNAWIDAAPADVDFAALVADGLDTGAKSGERNTEATPRDFGSGAVGYNFSGQVTVGTRRRDGTTGPVRLQVSMNVMLPGSKVIANNAFPAKS